MKFLGVSGAFDYAGRGRCWRYRACSCCRPHITRASASGLTFYGAEYPPRLSSVYASLGTSRYPAQDSRPSGSLLLSRKELSSSASCRFIPAHCNSCVVSFGDDLRHVFEIEIIVAFHICDFFRTAKENPGQCRLQVIPGNVFLVDFQQWVLLPRAPDDLNHDSAFVLVRLFPLCLIRKLG